MLVRSLAVATVLCCSASALAQFNYTSQSRTIMATGVGGVTQTAAAPDFNAFTAGVSSPAGPNNTGTATASHSSTLGSTQIRMSGSAFRDKSVGQSSGYGQADSTSSISFTVATDTPFNFSTSFRYAQVSLTGPGVNMVHGYVDTTSENGTFLAGQTYTVYAQTQGDIQVGNAIAGGFDLIVSLNGTPPTPTSLTASPTGAVCPGTLVVLTVAAPPAGHVIDWYSNTYIGTGTSIEVYPPSLSAYSAQTRRVSDGAISFTTATIIINMRSVIRPSTAAVNRDNLCQYDNGTIQLTATGGLGSDFQWFSGSCDGPMIGTGSSITIPSPNATTTYYVRRVNVCGMVSTCLPKIVTVKPCPGDFSCDSMIDDSDFTAFAAAYDMLLCSDPSMTLDCPADMNGDELVDDLDFALFVTAYDNLTCPS